MYFKFFSENYFLFFHLIHISMPFLNTLRHFFLRDGNQISLCWKKIGFSNHVVHMFQATTTSLLSMSGLDRTFLHLFTEGGLPKNYRIHKTRTGNLVEIRDKHLRNKYNVFNLFKTTGHVMQQQFNIQQLYVLPTLYLCVLYLSENKQRLVPLTA